MKRKKEPIRILQCVSNMDRAGIETMLMNFYRNIDRNVIQFDFLCNKPKHGDYDEEIKKLGGKIYVTPGLNPLKWFKYQKYMKQLFREHPEYKIIHCQNESMGFPALYAAKHANIPVRISHSHNTVTRLDFKWPIKVIYKRLIPKVATHRVACSKAAGEFFFKNNYSIIYNAIDTTKFIFDRAKREKIRKKLNINNSTYVLGHVGRFESQKNHKFLINLFFEYLKTNDNALLLLIGSGSLERKIKNKVEMLGISTKVIFLGNIPNVNDYYNAMDLFILPSFHEGLPVVGIEAQISSLPCVFSDKITKEVKISSTDDFVSLNASVKYWIEKIEKFRNSQKNYRRKNEEIDSKYDIKDATIKLANWYKKLYAECIDKNNNYS